MADTLLMLANQVCSDVQKRRPDIGRSRLATTRAASRPSAAPVAPLAALESVRSQRYLATKEAGARSATIDLPLPPPLPLLIEQCAEINAKAQSVVAPPVPADSQQAVLRAKPELKRPQITEPESSLAAETRTKLCITEVPAATELLPIPKPLEQPRLPLLPQPSVRCLGRPLTAAPYAQVRCGVNSQLCEQLALYLGAAATPRRIAAAGPAAAISRFQFDTQSPDDRVSAAMARQGIATVAEQSRDVPSVKSQKHSNSQSANFISAKPPS